MTGPTPSTWRTGQLSMMANLSLRRCAFSVETVIEKSSPGSGYVPGVRRSKLRTLHGSLHLKHPIPPFMAAHIPGFCHSPKHIYGEGNSVSILRT